MKLGQKQGFGNAKIEILPNSGQMEAITESRQSLQGKVQTRYYDKEAIRVPSIHRG